MRAERAFIWNDSATTPSQACYPAPVRSPRRVRALGARLSPPPRPGEPADLNVCLLGIENDLRLVMFEDLGQFRT